MGGFATETEEWPSLEIQQGLSCIPVSDFHRIPLLSGNASFGIRPPAAIAFLPPGPARARDSKTGFLKPGLFRILPPQLGTRQKQGHRKT